MSFIQPIQDDQASDAVNGFFEADRARLGYVANYTRVFAHRPDVYAAWLQLNGAIKQTMDRRRYELATLAAARQLRSSYCSLAHGKVLVDQYLDPETVRAVVLDHTSSGLEPVEVAVMDLAEKIARDATSVKEEDIERLRGLGLSDDDIFDVVAAAAARCFFSKSLDALAVHADAAYLQLEPALREALTVGRPIADG
jgi:uncharacterized peroxidase-related enzyme